MRRQMIAAGFALATTLSGAAVADESIRQTRVSVTLAVPEFPRAANDLRQVSQSFDASLENLNLDSGSGSGSATFKVLASQVPEVMADLEKVGQIQNQSQSTSDYTGSVAQYQRKAKAFRSLAELDSRSLFAKLPAESRAEVMAEFQSFVTSGLQNNESSAVSYRDMGKMVEISVSLTGSPQPANGPSSVATPEPEASQTVPPPSSSPADTRPIYLLCLLNFLGLWAIYRRVDRPDPLLQTPHTH